MLTRMRTLIISIGLALFILLIAAFSLVALAAAVVTTSPGNGAVGVAGSGTIVITYDEAVNPVTVDSSTFPVYSNLRGRQRIYRTWP